MRDVLDDVEAARPDSARSREAFASSGDEPAPDHACAGPICPACYRAGRFDQPCTCAASTSATVDAHTIATLQRAVAELTRRVEAIEQHHRARIGALTEP